MKSTESSLFEKRRSATETDRRQLTIILTTGWAVLTVILFSLVILMDFRRFESDFNDISQRVKDQLDARIAKNEAVLEGFASYLAGLESYNEAQLSQYASRIIKRFPHIFMLEVATKVAAADIDMLVERQRAMGYPEFEIKAFDYRGSREWRLVEQAEYFYPLTFIYPLREGSRPVLGLDLGSNENLRPPLQRALETGNYQTSLPFKLVEGYEAYVMFMPVYKAVNEQGGVNDDPNHQELFDIVLVILLQEHLVGDLEQMLPESMGVMIYHSDRDAEDPIGWLFSKSESVDSLLPRLVNQYKLEPEREGFVLKLEQNFGMDSISTDVLILVTLASALIFFSSRHFILRRYRRDMSRSKKEARLEHLASYDPLTQLPNKNRFQQWLEEGLKTLDDNTSLAAVLMDLDDLKEVNERYGHAVGDRVLQEIAKRIVKTLRREDLVARIGGDEFVAILTHISTDEQVSVIVDKLTQYIEAPMNFTEGNIRVKVNIGVAFYPEGTSEPDQLVQLADKVMYQAKRTRERRDQFR